MFLLLRSKKRSYKRQHSKNHAWKKHKPQAEKLVQQIIQEIHDSHNKTFKYNRITIRNQKTRWGSCSSRGNLNFNYRVVFLPHSLAKYLVVHELCHLIELNHSKAYWKLVEEILPNHKELRKELKKVKIQSL
jgi:predicted metal-dependent hydrolase